MNTPTISNTTSNNIDNNPDSLSNTLIGLISRSVKPDVLEKIQELDRTNSDIQNTQLENNVSIPSIKNVNPLRKKSGLYFRDMVKQPNLRKI